MVTFLDLLKTAYSSTGQQGEVYSVDDPGLPSILAKAISAAWVSIQEDNSKDWNFTDDVVDFNLSPGRVEYTPDEILGANIINFGAFSSVLYEGTALDEIPVLDFKITVADADPRRPSKFAISPSTGNLFVNKVSVTEPVKVVYEIKTQVLTSDDDVVRIIDKNQGAIVWLGLLNYSTDIGNRNLQIKADKMLRTAYSSFCRKYNKGKRMKTKLDII